MRRADAKPTPAGDMFSYGVCCLFACCLPADVNAQQAAVRQPSTTSGRSPWSRDAAGKADTHLPDLLESLFESTAADRLSASEALLHPFHNTAAAIEASAQAQAQAAAATHEDSSSRR